ncbi:hypothetical protein U1Q18_012240, partial [Sarracenia purpurea var. burkii]
MVGCDGALFSSYSETTSTQRRRIPRKIHLKSSIGGATMVKTLLFLYSCFTFLFRSSPVTIVGVGGAMKHCTYLLFSLIPFLSPPFTVSLDFVPSPVYIRSSRSCWSPCERTLSKIQKKFIHPAMP